MLRFTMREMQPSSMPERHPLGFVIAATVMVSLGFGVLFALLGVYDTNIVPIHKRIVFWTATMITGIGGALLVLPFFPNCEVGSRPYWLRIVPIALIVSVPVTFVLTFFNPQFGLNSSLSHWLYQYVLVLQISLIVIGMGHLGFALWGRRSGTIADVSRAGASRRDHPFLARLSPAIRQANLYAISGEDHYLRVHTSAGEELILMRLGDAMGELKDWPGTQVHRSWWVAQDGIDTVVSKKGRRYLRLKSGVEAPVSRTFLENAKKAGLVT